MTQGTFIAKVAGRGQATSYAEWTEIAQSHDLKSGKHAWRDDDESSAFDSRSVSARLQRLATLRRNGDSRGLLFALNEGIHGNMDGIANDSLWREARYGTKNLIHRFVDEITKSLLYLASPDADSISDEEKHDFFRRASHCYGCSALLLSGSGAFISFHAGVAKALHAENVLPKIISGSSGGAVIGAIVCTNADAEIQGLLDAKSFADHGIGHNDRKRFTLLGFGAIMAQEEVEQRLAALIPDLTFQEAFERTGRHFSVSVAPAEMHQSGRLLNAITSPNVFVRDAVRASCAVPGIFEPVTLMAKDDHGRRVPFLPGSRWIDGSITHDLPLKRLSRLYGVNHHIVSQANPLVAPFTGDMKLTTSPFLTIRNAAILTMKAWLNAQMTLFERPLSFFSGLSAMTVLSMSLLNQEVSGDINIVRPMFLLSPAKLLSNLSISDVGKLIALGEQAAWPKVEMIRTQSLVSVTLTAILADFDEREKQSNRKRDNRPYSPRPVIALS
jgi:TAG lipase / steryl ester hydrolase / phospholipase A2 / LPA acyltransferase